MGFSYDDLDRLTRADYGIESQSEIFELDKLGNRESVVLRGATEPTEYVVDDLTNRYAQVGAAYPLYDDAGNTIEDRDGNVYTYDYENRVIRIEDAWGTLAEFEYDALGRRIMKSDGGSDTFYYYNDNWQVLAQVEPGRTIQYVYGNYIDEPLVMNDGTDDFYYAQDHLNSTVALVDEAGEVVERYEYDGYGSVRVFEKGSDGQWFTADDEYWPGGSSPYTFTGRELDIIPSLYHGYAWLMNYRHRTYDTHTGRFLQHDPLEYVDGMSLYEYVKSSPANASDPLGLRISTMCTDAWQYLAAQPPGLEHYHGMTTPSTYFHWDVTGCSCPQNMGRVRVHDWASSCHIDVWVLQGTTWRDAFGYDIVAHERLHVTGIQDIWEDIANTANNVEARGCMPIERAYCYDRALEDYFFESRDLMDAQEHHRDFVLHTGRDPNLYHPVDRRVLERYVRREERQVVRRNRVIQNLRRCESVM